MSDLGPGRRPRPLCDCLRPENPRRSASTDKTPRCMKILLFASLLSAVPVLAAEPTSTAAKAINALGIDLLRKAEPPDANALLSPYSIQSALAMAYAGADGVTREEMRKVLHFPKDDSEVNRSVAALRTAPAQLMEE